MEEITKWADLKKSSSYKQKRGKIKNSLLRYLDANNAKKEPFTDMVEQYMTLWDTFNQLGIDIARRGVSVNGTHGLKKNDSVPEQQKTNKQMMSILAYLGMNPENLPPPEGDDDDDTI
ncbi:P27 family phage terminase small subunit [Listeria booriae]|uniref:P27 family phage terminase small subunit n=1 Tax=Listeria booriae TaxID=1552123 RepID=A0A842FS12_9LIST|nr:P27 family phage terminase small subunit [Listeria booriae]MBC2285889.1 P27 family phage terminase small subunit [Listeria booriae]